MFTGVMDLASLVAAVAVQGFPSAGNGGVEAVEAYCDFHNIDRDARAVSRSLEAQRFCGRADCITEDLMRLPNGRDIRWTVAGSWKVPVPHVAQAFSWAWRHWQDACDVAPRMVQTVAEANVVFEGRPIDDVGRTLAISDWPDGDRQVWGRFDASESWVFMQDPPKFKVDLGRVAVHEIGHLLGIPHLAAGAMMQPMYDLKLRGLQPADRAEAVRRYGPPKGRMILEEPPAANEPVMVTIRVPVESISIPGYSIKRS